MSLLHKLVPLLVLQACRCHGQWHQQPSYAQQQLSGHQYSTQTASPNVTHLLNNSSNQQQQQQLPQQLPAQVHDHSRSEMSRNERVAGIVSLLEGGAGGSTRNLPKVLEFAKKCPTKWSKQATLSNINLPLYAWGVVEEVESALSGRSQAMEPGTILGKLRHLKNSLEICCQNSSSSEFGGYGWNLAKDYATKLTEEIDQGRSSWQDVQLEVKTSTLMSATMENPRPPLRQDPLPKVAKGEGGSKRTKKTFVQPTTSARQNINVILKFRILGELALRSMNATGAELRKIKAGSTRS